ncbi:MAG: CBS domain-containing protein, partial [Gammaproteobacteria bacterium]
MDGGDWPLGPHTVPLLVGLLLVLICVACALLLLLHRARTRGRPAAKPTEATTFSPGSTTAADLMVPRDDIVGLDLDWPLDTLLEHVSSSRHTRLPVWRGQVENIVGVLHLRRLVRHLTREELSADTLLTLLEPPLFVPEGTPLNALLQRLRRERRGLALVVDEYGDLLGLVTPDDIMAEWVGQSGADAHSGFTDIHPQPDGTVVIDGRAALRDINRTLAWDLPHE